MRWAARDLIIFHCSVSAKTGPSWRRTRRSGSRSKVENDPRALANKGLNFGRPKISSDAGLFSIVLRSSRDLFYTALAQ